jgi:lipoprotein-anchoring transpeptidase ErfK/SrfK
MKRTRIAAGGHTTNWIIALLFLATVLPCLAQSSPTPPQAVRLVLVSIPDRKLAVLENGKVLAYFPVAVGAAVSPSPTGDFLIVSRAANPTYSHRGAVMAAGKDNPAGTRWIGLSVKGYGIHGTNSPRSIGHATSHGCIRLRNHDVETLYAMLRLGDVVEIRGERDQEIVQVFGDAVDLTAARVTSATVGQ